MQNGNSWDQMIGCCHRTDVSFNGHYQFSEKTSLRSVSKIRKGDDGLYKVSLRELQRPMPIIMSRRESNLLVAPNVSKKSSVKKSISSRQGSASSREISNEKVSLRAKNIQELKNISSTCPETAQSSCKLFKKKPIESSVSGEKDLESKGRKYPKSPNPEKTLNPKALLSIKKSSIQSARRPKRTMEELRKKAGVSKLNYYSHRPLEPEYSSKIVDSEEDHILESRVNEESSVIIDESFVVVDYFNPSKSRLEHLKTTN